MNPNSISLQLFVSALTAAGQPPAKRSVRSAARSVAKTNAPKAAPTGHAAQKSSAWSWSGWQHPTI